LINKISFSYQVCEEKYQVFRGVSSESKTAFGDVANTVNTDCSRVGQEKPEKKHFNFIPKLVYW
jgi:hypothetical protein